MKKEIIIKVENFKDGDFKQEFIRVETIKPYNVNTEFPKQVEGKVFTDKQEAREYILNFLSELKCDIDFDPKEITFENYMNANSSDDRMRIVEKAFKKLNKSQTYK